MICSFRSIIISYYYNDIMSEITFTPPYGHLVNTLLLAASYRLHDSTKWKVTALALQLAQNKKEKKTQISLTR